MIRLKNKHNNWFVLLIILVLTGALFLYFFNNHHQQVNFKENITPVETIFGKNGDNLTEGSVSHINMLNFAFRLGRKVDKKFCNNFKSFHNNFLGACYAGVAVRTNNNSLCDLSKGKTECYSILAYFKKDISLCNTLDTWLQPACTLRAGYGIKNYSICDSIKTPPPPLPKDVDKWVNLIDACKIGVGLANNDISICGKIETGDCYTRMATKMKNSDICNKIEPTKQTIDENIKKCFHNVALTNMNLDECEKKTNSLSSLKGLCVRPILLRTTSLEACNRYINDDSIGNIFCYKTVAIAKRDLSICEKIKELEKFTEIQEAASGSLTKLNLSKEEVAKNYSFFLRYDPVGSCVSDIAKNSGDMEICEKITNIAGRENCYKDVEKLLEKKDKCNIIKDEYLRNDCMEILARPELLGIL